MPVAGITTMALPTVKSLAECADLQKGFIDFLPQIYELPNGIIANIGSKQGLIDVYSATNPAVLSFAFCLLLFPLFFIGSEANKNYSQVDRVWSILPTIFNCHYAIWARLNGLPTDRLDHILAFSIVWSIRLTFNYWRKGGYEVGSEDYRWLIIQQRIGKLGFMLLNILFISSWQILILWGVTLPTYLMLLTSRIDPAINIFDTSFSRLLTGLVVFEYFADQQMWDYQQAKKSYKATAVIPPGWSRGQMERGFVTTGLWRWSRHPNFAAEQSIWVVLYAWGAWSSRSWWNWTSFGAINYLAVFVGSTPLTEIISASKYPEYGIYIERVGRFFPKLFGKGWDEAEMHRIGPKLAEAKKLAEEKKKQK